MIKFLCKKCFEPLEAPESLAGEPLQCPKCKTKTKVPPNKRLSYPFVNGFFGTIGILVSIGLILNLPVVRNPARTIVFISGFIVLQLNIIIITLGHIVVAIKKNRP